MKKDISTSKGGSKTPVGKWTERELARTKSSSDQRARGKTPPRTPPTKGGGRSR